jgi:hypothetical protein
MFQDEENRIKERMEKAYMPYRFWLEPGSQCEITLLDASLEEGFARPEHNLKGADGKYGNIVPCIRNEADCPLCRSDRESTLVLYLSILVHRPYVVKKTGETREYSKMFLCLKRGQYNDFARIEKMAIKKYGTLRGVTILLARDNERNAFGTGTPIANEDGNMLADFYNEKELIEAFGHKAVKAKEGNKIIKPENDDVMPYDYKKLMPQPDVDDYLSEYGGAPAPGSRKAAQSYKDEEEPKDSDGEADEEEEDEKKPSPPTQARRRPVAKQEQDEDDEADEADDGDDEEEEEEKPKPSPRLRRGRGEKEIDFD